MTTRNLAYALHPLNLKVLPTGSLEYQAMLDELRPAMLQVVVRLKAGSRMPRQVKDARALSALGRAS